MARFYADENFPHPVVYRLRDVGHDVLTAHAAGQANRAVPDDQVLAVATAAGRAVLTINRADFFELCRLTPMHAGIVACTADPNADRQAKNIAAAVAGSADLAGRLVRVHRGS